MNVFIVYAHPSKKSYTYQVLQKTIKALVKKGHSVEVSDLYTMNFCSDMNEQEYEREGLCQAEIRLPEDVIEEHKKIAIADCIIFIF